jgi:molecular chaperone HtpG
LKPLGNTFRNDLGLVCESHHLDDLDNVDKYKLSRPYGNSAAETANLQYAALLLRTTDLLHITLDRTPSIAFRVLNPSDPISQQEWAKQMAVRSVRPQLGKDREGNIDDTAPQDTIEVHATFDAEEGFFGLTSYLSYAQAQLQQSHEWTFEAAKHHGVKNEFPWRYIDDSFIETEGFLRKQFEFKIDQARILDLLTGHTLYNDTSVVLRELIQNSLDAIRLQFSGPNGQPGSHKEYGQVRIIWDSKRRLLEVRDNGTGMTQEIIENNLLKVGASRYQDPKFKDTYPDFNPISRFGIGVLSAFMIADTVEIITCHPDEEEGRYLSLRSVHGKYLIRLLNKESEEVQPVLPHGTLVRLSIRPSAEIEDVLALAQKWIVFPDCRVVVSIDGGADQLVGYESTKDALISALIRDGLLLPDQRSNEIDRPIKVEERRRDGVSVLDFRDSCCGGGPGTLHRDDFRCGGLDQ